MKSVIAEFAMDNELLRERIRRMEDEKPFLRCRSRKSAVPGRPPRGATTGTSRVLKAWGLPRSTFYRQRRRQVSPHMPGSHGPRARFSDEQLVGEIRHTIAASPFSGEGHSKV
ncbi:MAG: hypothetical protein ACUVXB_00505 [Bryobacteraceae bacterium]